MIPSHPTYDNIHTCCIKIAEQTKQVGEKYDMIVGLSRGGLVPGVIVSHYLDVPFKPLEYSSTKGKGDGKNVNLIPVWIAENKTPQHVLLIDDIADSGHTMKEVVEILSGNNFYVSTAVIYYKAVSVVHPDFIGWVIPEDFGWIIFPFEKK